MYEEKLEPLPMPRLLDVEGYRWKLRVLKCKYQNGGLPQAAAAIQRAIEVLDETTGEDAAKEAGRG